MKTVKAPGPVYLATRSFMFYTVIAGFGLCIALIGYKSYKIDAIRSQPLGDILPEFAVGDALLTVAVLYASLIAPIVGFIKGSPDIPDNAEPVPNLLPEVAAQQASVVAQRAHFELVAGE